MIEQELERTLDLARIAFTPEDRTQLAADVEAILEHFLVLAGADLPELAPVATRQAGLRSLRPDLPRASGPHPGDLLDRAPETDQGFVLVPAVI